MGSRLTRMLAGALTASAVVLMAFVPGPQPHASQIETRASVPLEQRLFPEPPTVSTLGIPATDNWPKAIDPKTYNIYKGPNLSARVVLTYDDCPDNLTALNSVLRYVRDKNIGLVLAPTGQCYDRFKRKYKTDIIKLMRDHGQYVINHSYGHPNLTKLTPAQIRAQISGEVKSDYGRPPYGARNSKVNAAYRAVGMRQWLWQVDTGDWENGGKSQSKIVNYTIAKACRGCTVLMHMQHNGFNPQAIGAIQSGLRNKKGLELCRAFRGFANPPGGPVRTSPAKLGNNALPC